MAYEMDQRVILLAPQSSKDFNAYVESILSMYFTAGWHIAQISGTNYLSKHYPKILTQTPMYALFVLLERPKNYRESFQR